MIHLCTYFNSGYLLRGLTLYQSLKQHCQAPFVLWVLCFDEKAFDTLAKLNHPDLRPIALSEFERTDPALQSVKPQRSTAEYFFTCTPSWPLFLLDHFPEIEQITYLDADMYFYQDLQLIYDEIGAGSIAIIPHRFPTRLEYLADHGIYNVGLLTFRNDANGRTCLEWWRARCLEWCYDRVEDGKFADQRYLDDWPTRFNNVVVLSHKGANLAPWNIGNYAITRQGGQIVIDDQPLVFFHFQGMKIFNANLYDTGLTPYRMAVTAGVQGMIYTPYFTALREAHQYLRQVVPEVRIEYSKILSRGYSATEILRSAWHRQLVWTLR